MTASPESIQSNEESAKAVLMTGATGYVGGRLGPRLLEAGHHLKCVTRSAAKLRDRPWARDRRVEIIEADVADQAALTEAMRGCFAAYYLVHSMVAANASYRSRDRELASSFAGAAREAGVERIIYLGGLGELGEDLSKHLASRREVEAVLAEPGVPVTVFRAAMIIGSGSASFEILRYLTERLPVMITPRWVFTRSQPIAIRDVLHYLVQCLSVPATAGRTLDIGGPDVLTYRALIDIMAESRGLNRRIIVPVPVLTPRLSSLWLHLVTPVDYRIARPLAEGLRNEVVCRDESVHELMPHRCLSATEAIDAALGKLSSTSVETKWSDAGVLPGDPDWAGGTLLEDRRTIDVDAPPQRTFAAILRIGGEHGYYHADWMWRLRGAMDRLVGGPGLRRGRRHPTQLMVGDALDFWRVTAIDPDRELVLRAEMKLPGIAELSFTVDPLEGDRSRLALQARFRPKGLLGLCYWYAVLPLHSLVFRPMLKGIKRDAESHPAAHQEAVDG